MNDDADYGRCIIGRREGERIFIGNDIELRIAKARDGQARIIITAPKSVILDRPGQDGDAEDRAEFRTWKEHAL